MTKKVTVTRYAKTTHGQPNANIPDAKHRNDWTNYNQSSAADTSIKPSGNAQSYYWIGQGTDKHIRKPWTFAANDFDLDIPSCAYITKVTFTAMMKITGKINVDAPQARFNLYHGSKNVANNVNNHTGWQDGYYYVKPNKKLTNNWQPIEYVMTGTEFHRRGYPVSELMNDLLGIDLRWYDPVKPNGSPHYVYIQYVSCTVEYELPDQSVVMDMVTSEDYPYITNSGSKFNILAKYYNRSNAGCCNGTERKIKVNLPPNVRAKSLNGIYDSSTSEWTVQCTPNAYETLLLEVVDYGIGGKCIDFTNEEVNSRFWYYSSPVANDVGEVSAYLGQMQLGVQSCTRFEATVNASDGKANFNIILSTKNNGMKNVTWTLDKSRSSPGVTLDSSDDTHVNFSVPKNKIVDIVFTGCFIPTARFEDGGSTMEVQLDNNPEELIPYKILDAPVFHVRNKAKTSESNREIAEIVLNPSTINFITHRIASQTELGAYVIECGVDPFDKTMIEKECTLTADTWEQVDYIGVVPLEYHHYDPDSTYSNKAISDSYKNKTYKGKEGVIEEKISLKFKARPWQTPTLQGMTKLDKPTPINANHKCFESDPLNHRGWAVLSEVKIKRTNPLWYDVEADVDYITHDIHTKFQIFKDKQVNEVPMPDLTAEVFGLEESFASRLDLFNVDTDGGFLYDEDGDEGTNNIFSLDEGQKLTIKTIKALSDVANIRFDWYSNRINETRENNLERVFRLVDDTGESVLEYEYTGFNFYEDYITCTVIVRVKTVDGWKTSEYPDVDMRMEVEADPIVDIDEETDVDYDTDASEEEYYYYDAINEEYVLITDDEYDGDLYQYDETTGTYVLVTDDDDDSAYEEGYVAPTFDLNKYNVTQVYGTSLIFNLKGNKLKITDEGYNGREFVRDEIELLSDNYHFETEWTNNNQDGTTEDIISYMGLSLEETILETDYSKYYKDVLVSPFPIPYKTVMFTRESEEGTIYYLTGNEPFKYLLEPYYQYHCGCDLLGDRTSIFDLNNSYTHYYIENGLVRLGFNKYNGRLYLAKYDPNTDEWITTHYFHLVNEPKFAVETYSDDKIVIKAGNDTFFTIWRGRPFIGIENPTDTIYIDSKFNYCLSDKINGERLPYPVIYSFNNTDNLLPVGVGGNSLDYDEFTIDDDEEIITTDHDITLSVPSDILANDEITFTPTVSDNPTNGKVYLFIDGVKVGNASSPFTLKYTFQGEGSYKVYAAYVGEDTDNIAFSPVYDVVVKPRPLTEEPHPEIQGAYNLSIVSAPKKFIYRDYLTNSNQKVVMQLKKGTTPIKWAVVECVYPNGSTVSKRTGADGKFEITNNNTEFVPGKHQWGAMFYDPATSKLVCSALRWISIEKATPTFTHNDSDGKVSKGKSLTVKLNGVDSKADSSKIGIVNTTVTYSINGGKKVSTKTNKNGKFSVKFNTIGTKKLKVMFAGSKRYKAISKTFTIKVVK